MRIAAIPAAVLRIRSDTGLRRVANRAFPQRAAQLTSPEAGLRLLRRALGGARGGLSARRMLGFETSSRAWSPWVRPFEGQVP